MLEKVAINYLLGIFTPSKWGRLRTIAALLNLVQIRGVRATSKVRHTNASAKAFQGQKRTQADRRMVEIKVQMLRPKLGWTKRGVHEAFMELERRLKMKPPRNDGHSNILYLHLENMDIRRAAVAWYCGLFLGKEITRDSKVGQPQGKAIETIKKNTRKKRW